MDNSKAETKTTSSFRRRSGPAKRARQTHWFDPSAARAHLQQLDQELARIKAERDLIMHVLGGRGAIGQSLGQGLGQGTSGSELNNGFAFRPRPGRRPAHGGPSMLDLLERIISQGPVGKGWTVGELREELVRVSPARATIGNASSLISSALVQALRAKRPRFLGTKAGRGHARRYRLAATQG